MNYFSLGRLAFVMVLSLISLKICSTDKALGFPQNTRLGYANCSTCHYSHTGGGALKPYGKSTAAELSTWSTEIDPADTRFISAGDIRYLSIQTQTPEATAENKFLMASSLELGYEGRLFDYVVEVGQYYSFPVPIVGSYRHYIQTTILGLGVRFGKFAPSFGINTEDHTLPGRNDIGFDSRDAGVNTEIFYGGKAWNYSLTLVQGCQGILSDVMQSGYCDEGRSGLVGHLGWSYSKPVYLSFSGAYTETPKGRTQNAYALGWVIGNRWLYTMGEYTYNDEAAKPEKLGWIDLIGTYRGLDLGLTFRRYEAEDVPGIKLRWLPIDHVEFTSVYLYQENFNRLVATGHLYF